MDAVLRWSGFVVGLWLVLAVWSSIITTIIVPRSVTSRITFMTWRVVHVSFMLVADRLLNYERKDRFLTLLSPIALLATLATWISLFMLSFALLMWPFIPGSFGEAVRLSGSSLFTLGVASAPGAGPASLEFLAAATGMIVVALQIGYLPALYSAYNRRETLVTALSTRVGSPAWGPELLARHQLNKAVSTLPALFAAWENWAADIAESHTSYPWLMTFRSPDLLQSWVISLLAVLDAAALYLALAPDEAPPEARQCLRAGYVALQTLARIVGYAVDHDPLPDAPLQLPFEAFAQGVEHVRLAGFPITRTAEQAWRDYHGWRVNYEAAAFALANAVVAVPAPWSGKRQHMTYQAVFDVMENRPRHRTPDDPAGLGGLTGVGFAAMHARMQAAQVEPEPTSTVP